MRRSLASGAGPPETGARSRCLASRNAMRRLSRRSRSSVIRIIATAIRTPPTTGAARTMAYLIISPPTISRHVCGPNGLHPAGLGYSVPVVTPCRPTYACPQILPSASYKSRNHCSSKLSDGARGGTFMYWAMVYLVELAGAAIHELHPERRLPRPRRSRDQEDVPPRNAAEQNVVEPLDSCFHQVCFRHEAPPASMGLIERALRI